MATASHRIILYISGVASLLAAGVLLCGWGPTGAGSAQTSQGPLMHPESKHWLQTAPDRFRIRVETTKGEFIVEARRKWAPVGVDRLYNLARAGFFDDSRFFRVRAGYIVQFGIAGDPAVAAIWRNQSIKDDRALQATFVEQLRTR